jgi:hypothetical protein
MERCKIMPGSFFERIFAQGDTYVLSRVLHDWDDKQALAILKSLRRSMPKQARLLILEMVVPGDGKPHPSKMFDIAMMVLFGGLERTKEEFADLLRSASFHLSAAMPTTGPTVVLEAIPS